MYLPNFDAATLANMLLSALIGAIVSFLLTNRSNQMAKAQQQREWEYTHLVRMRDEAVSELQNEEKRLPSPIISSGTGSGRNRHTVAGQEYFQEAFNSHKEKVAALRSRIAIFDAEIEKLRKDNG